MPGRKKPELEITGTEENIEEIDGLDQLDQLIGSFNQPESQSSIQSQSQTPSKLDSQLTLYESQMARITSTTDPNTFWSERVSSANDHLNLLAVVTLDIICVPVTEVITERLFSFLNYVFSKLRSCLKSDILNDILFCSWNRKLQHRNILPKRLNKKF